MSDRMFADCCYGTDHQHAMWVPCPFAPPLVTVPVRLPDPNLYSPEVREEMRLIMEGNIA